MKTWPLLLAASAAGAAVALLLRSLARPDDEDDSPIPDGWVVVSRSLETRDAALQLAGQLLPVTGDVILAQIEAGALTVVGEVMRKYGAGGEGVWH